MDHTVRIWDMRKRTVSYTIPAHSNLISSVRFEPERGSVLVTSSYDHTCKVIMHKLCLYVTSLQVWSAKDWKPLRTLSSHSDKVSDVDVASNASHIVSCSFDRTWKV